VEVAVERALTELHQSLGPVTRWERGEVRPAPSEESLVGWWQRFSLDDLPFLRGDGSTRARRDFHEPWRGSLEDHLARTVAMIRRCGLDIYAHDRTRPEIPLRIVRVVVPGLRHFRTRLAPGRLYDVPSALGWSAVPLSPERLNPVAMPY
jgi:ribosomal protein S12 methylthiotransferase accessory factor